MIDPEHESLRIRRWIRAPRQRVFDAFVRPELRRKWWFPEEGMTCGICEIDARVGGNYRVAMNDDRGAESREFICTGSFEEVDAPRKLVFTWTWQHELDSAGDPADVRTRVTVELEEANGGTDILITHERIRGADDRRGYAQGWNGCLLSLERALSAGMHTGTDGER